MPQYLQGSGSDRKSVTSLDNLQQMEKVELIVVGASGLNGISVIKELGSVERCIFEGASCPVMLVH